MGYGQAAGNMQSAPNQQFNPNQGPQQWYPQQQQQQQQPQNYYSQQMANGNYLLFWLKFLYKNLILRQANNFITKQLAKKIFQIKS